MVASQCEHPKSAANTSGSNSHVKLKTDKSIDQSTDKSIDQSTDKFAYTNGDMSVSPLMMLKKAYKSIDKTTHPSTDSSTALAYTMGDMTFGSLKSTDNTSTKLDNNSHSSNNKVPDHIALCNAFVKTERQASIDKHVTESFENGLAYSVADMTSKCPDIQDCSSADTSFYTTCSSTSRLGADDDDADIVSRDLFIREHSLQMSATNKLSILSNLENLSPVYKDPSCNKSRENFCATPDIFSDQSNDGFETKKRSKSYLTSTRLTPEHSAGPVHMSTPLSANAGLDLCQSDDKENTESKHINYSKKSKVGVTPLSAIPKWHKRRILSSSIMDSPNPSNKNLTVGPASMTAMFGKSSELGGDTMADSMLTGDRDKLEEILADFHLNGELLSGTYL